MAWSGRQAYYLYGQAQYSVGAKDPVKWPSTPLVGAIDVL